MGVPYWRQRLQATPGVAEMDEGVSRGPLGAASAPANLLSRREAQCVSRPPETRDRAVRPLARGRDRVHVCVGCFSFSKTSGGGPLLGGLGRLPAREGAAWFIRPCQPAPAACRLAHFRRPAVVSVGHLLDPLRSESGSDDTLGGIWLSPSVGVHEYTGVVDSPLVVSVRGWDEGRGKVGGASRAVGAGVVGDGSGRAAGAPLGQVCLAPSGHPSGAHGGLSVCGRDGFFSPVSDVGGFLLWFRLFYDLPVRARG